MKKRTIAAVMLSCLLVFGGCSTQNGGIMGPAWDTTPALTDTPTDTPAPTDTPDPTPGSTDPVPDLVPPEPAGRDAIPFEEGQLYAAAYLGYRTTDGLDRYIERFLDSDKLPVHYVSDGDYYLVIPRYDGMALSLYVNDFDTSLGTLRFFDPDCGPFIIQCNASDIFDDVTVRLEYGGAAAEFSPHISLKDGSLVLGALGLDLTITDPA